MSTATAQALATQLSDSFRDLCKTFAQLQVDEIDSGLLVNQWSPKTLMAHIAFWDDRQTTRMQTLISGAQRISQPAQTNDERALLDNNRLWQEILASAESARQRMIDFVNSLNDEALNQDYTDGERALSANALFQHMLRHTHQHRQEVSDYCGSMARWTRPALRRFVVEQYATLLDSISGLDETTILASKVCGIWSMRDVLAHVLSWNEFEYRVLKNWPQIKPDAIEEWMFLENEDTDSVNARLLAARSDLDIIAICDWLVTYHRKILHLLDNASDETLSATADIGWGQSVSMSGVIYSMSMHDLEHAEAIWQWKAEKVAQ